MQKIDVLAFTPNEEKQVKKIPNTPDGFNSLIGGNFVLVSLYELIPYKIVLVFNRQAIIDGKDQSLWIGTEYVHGTCVMTKLEGAEFVSLTNDDMLVIEEWLERKNEGR